MQRVISFESVSRADSQRSTLARGPILCELSNRAAAIPLAVVSDAVDESIVTE